MIRALVLDVDGVLTDGGVILDEAGKESKRFHSRDGVGIRLALLAGWRVLFLTARESHPARHRATELGAEWAIGVKQKERFLEAWLEKAEIPWEHVAFVGDDLQDLASMRRSGWPIAVRDACPEVREAARYLTATPGGSGAVRDAVEWALDQNGVRASVIDAFIRGGFGVGEESRGGGRS